MLANDSHWCSHFMTESKLSTFDFRDIIAKSCPLPWFPGAAPRLVRDAVCQLLMPRGLSLQSYGTCRFLASGPGACREELFRITVPNALPVIGEQLSPHTFRQYKALGLRQSREPYETIRRIQRTIISSIGYFGVSETLRMTISHLVRCIHLIDADDDSHDVSHSDPKVPFSIFISVPGVHATFGMIRVTESILHEAMHLQLSLLEGSTSLVAHADPICFSPWRNELRPPSSVLHGTYVFVCIWVFLELLSQRDRSPCILEYAQRRKSQLERELADAFDGLRPSDLTKNGRILVDLLKARFHASYR